MMLAHPDAEPGDERTTSALCIDGTVLAMLIVAGTITSEPGGRDAFLAAVQPMVSATLTEPGCREYTFSPDPNDDTRIMLYELWDDQSALDAHFASEHMAAWQEARHGLPVVGADIKKYVIASVEALG